MIPLQDQMEQAKMKYSKMKGEVIIQFASPYTKKDQVSKAAKALKRANPYVIVMHCMGYTQAMKDQVREITGKPVILSRSLVARTLKELISS
jgi:protein AroM